MNINITLSMLQDEIRYAIEEGIGNCPSWTSVNVFGKLLRIVALASGRIFVGKPLCRDEEWIQMTTMYSVDASNAIKEVQAIPLYLRPFKVPFTPTIRRAAEYRKKIAAKLKPQLNAMIEARKHTTNEDDDEHFDGLESGQHSLAAWSIVRIPLQPLRQLL